MNVLVIVPAYNESESIKELIEKVIGIGGLDILVINDCSKDTTSEIAKGCGAITIDLPCNLGIGGAVKTGYVYANRHGYRHAVQIDGDGQHDPTFIPKMLDLMKKESCDMVIGSRFIEDSKYKQTALRKIGGNIITQIIKLLSKSTITDPTSGYRLINERLIGEFAKEYPYDYPEPETNLMLLLKGYRVREINMNMNKRNKGKTFVTPVVAIWYMVKVIMQLLVIKIKTNKSQKVEENI